MTLSSKSRKITYLVGLFAALLLTAFLAKEYESPLLVVDPDSVDQLVRVHCGLHQGPCRLNFAGLEVEATLNPLGLLTMTPLVLELVSVEQSRNFSSPWKVWFEGRDMDMGRHFMHPRAPDSTILRDDAHAFRAHFDGMIPICSIDPDMSWLLNLQTVINEQVVRFSFELSSAGL